MLIHSGWQRKVETFQSWCLKEGDTIKWLKCFNLERILDAEMLGREIPPELSIGEYLNSVQNNVKCDYDCDLDED
jgi:hypothetical protein